MGSSSEWLVQVPISDLVALQSLPGELVRLQKENEQLRRELDGVRRIQSETLQLVGDMRRKIK